MRLAEQTFRVDMMEGLSYEQLGALYKEMSEHRRMANARFNLNIELWKTQTLGHLLRRRGECTACTPALQMCDEFLTGCIREKVPRM